jgi:hypothetical protein
MTDQRDILDRLNAMLEWLNPVSGSEADNTLRAAIFELTAHRAEIERLRKQLPEEMQDCTIQFRECANGHGWLTATNWLEHDCQQCEIERLKLGLYAARNSYPVRLPGDPVVGAREARYAAGPMVHDPGLNVTMRLPADWPMQADPPQPERWEFDAVSGGVDDIRMKADAMAVMGWTKMTVGYCDPHGSHWLWFRRRVTP